MRGLLTPRRTARGEVGRVQSANSSRMDGACFSTRGCACAAARVRGAPLFALFIRICCGGLAGGCEIACPVPEVSLASVDAD